MRRLLFTLLTVVGSAAPAAVVQAAEVQGVRLWAGPDHTRVVLDVSGPVEHTLFTLESPDRVVVDIPDARLGSRASVPPPDGLVGDIRTGVREKTDLRVVLDLAGRAHPRSFMTPPNEQYGHRLVIDLDPVGGSESAEARPVKEARAASTETGRDIVIAVDPGHGGEDPGATGRRGLKEKDAVLAISRSLKAAIDREPGMRAILTRESDYFIPLHQRREKARAARADLFVSIHADSFGDARARGAHVYVLSHRGASSERARYLAQRENDSDLIGGVSLRDKDDVLASVLLDLSQTASLSKSLDVGDKVLSGIGQVHHLHKSEVQQAGFAVLKSPDMPSILVETAFISNPQEERMLSDAAYQRRYAQAMVDGIRDYFWDSPPEGTLLAALKENPEARRAYVVSRGDTLSEIARRHNLDVATLKAANDLRSDVIRTGQVISIPSGL